MIIYYSKKGRNLSLKESLSKIKVFLLTYFNVRRVLKNIPDKFVIFPIPNFVPEMSLDSLSMKWISLDSKG